MPNEPGYTAPLPFYRDMREIKKLTIGSSQTRSHRFKRRRGGGGSSTSNATTRALVTNASGATPYGTTGMTPGTVGKCVLLNEDGVAINAAGDPLSNIAAATAADKIEFKSEIPIKIWDGAIVNLSSNDAIEAGTTWDGAGGSTVAKVWANPINAQPIIIKAPGGIPADGNAQCDVYEWGVSGLVDSNVNILVYNIASVAVASNVYLQAKPIGGRYVVDYELCPA